MRKKMTWILFSFVAVFLSALTAFAFFPKNDLWDAVKEKAKAGHTVIHLRDVTDFAWDTVCVLEPYSLGSSNNDPKRIEKYIQGELGLFEGKIPNLNDDYLWAFTFIKDGKVIEIAERGRGFFIYKDYEINCMTNENAHFYVDGKKLYIRDYKKGI